jgi:multiple sugar transport system permease protein
MAVQSRGSVQHRSNFLLALPTIILLVVFSLFPFFYLLGMSFTESKLARPFQEFVGLMHYKDALVDQTFQTSLVNTLIFAFGVTTAETIIGFALALYFYRHMQAGKYLRTLALFPFIAPPVAVAMIWRLIYDPVSGLINHYLRQWGLTIAPIPFLGDPNLALPSIMLIDIWQWTPFIFLLSLAALQALPKDPYEAAAVDGASGWQTFWHITLPMVSPALIVIALIRLIGAFKIFDQIYILTGGGPGSRTQVASFYIYRTAFKEFDTGYAAALTIILLVVLVVVVTLLTMFRNRIRDRYE